MYCAFRDHLDKVLRDYLFCRIRSEGKQKNPRRSDLILKKAVELAQGMDAADRNARALKGEETAVQKLYYVMPCY
jgi:hypothetical protein